jgi:hypothetical protein
VKFLRELLERNEHYIPKREAFDYGVVCEKKGLWVLNRIGLFSFSKFQSIDKKDKKLQLIAREVSLCCRPIP